MKRSIISLFLIFTMLFSILAMIPVNAVESDESKEPEEAYTPSESYLSGKFSAKLSALELTGDQATDILLVALSQFGYHEGGNIDELSGESLEMEDYAEYNRISGTSQENNGYGWCATFVAWCARQAGISEDIIPTKKYCIDLVEDFFEPAGLYHTSKSGYIPQSGDIIFFEDDEGNARTPDHVGIVICTTNEKVWAIEGDSNKGYVSIFDYNLNSKSGYIVGYASPKYSKNPNTEITFKRETTAGNYFVRELDSTVIARQEANELSDKVKTLNYGERVAVTEVSGDWAKLDFGGWVKMEYLQYSYQDSFALTYNTLGGSLIPSVTIKDGKTSVPSEIPTKKGYKFGHWSLSNNGNNAFEKSDTLSVKPEDVVLYAVWIANDPVAITLKDGDTVIDTINIKLEQDARLPELPAKASENELDYNYEPLGWDANGDGTVDYKAGDTLTPEKNIELNAVYKKVYCIYTITFIGLKGETLSTQELKYGEMPKAPETIEGYFSEDGSEEYVFDNWSAEIKEVSGSFTYTAVAKVITKAPEQTTTPEATTQAPTGQTTAPSSTSEPSAPSAPESTTAAITTAGSTDNSEASSNTATIIIIIVVMVILAGALVALILIYKFKIAK